jgi:hypothetical protein
MKRISTLFVLSLALGALSLPARKAAAQQVTTKPCNSFKHSLGTIGTSASTFPNNTPGANPAAQGGGTILANGQLAARRFVTFCVTKESTNPASALVRIRTDGTAPANSATDPGTVLAVGDCVSFPISSNSTPKLISTSASTYVSAFECAG